MATSHWDRLPLELQLEVVMKTKTGVTELDDVKRYAETFQHYERPYLTGMYREQAFDMYKKYTRIWLEKGGLTAFEKYQLRNFHLTQSRSGSYRSYGASYNLLKDELKQERKKNEERFTEYMFDD